jgi:hypothetical protein
MAMAAVTTARFGAHHLEIAGRERGAELQVAERRAHVPERLDSDTSGPGAATLHALRRRRAGVAAVVPEESRLVGQPAAGHAPVDHHADVPAG